MHILITDKVDNLFIDLLTINNISFEYNTHEKQETILKRINKFNGIVVRNRLKIDDYFLNKAKNLKFIARYGSGMESINVKKAEELNIKCFNSAEGNCNSVSEHTMGLLLSLLHNIRSSMYQINNHIWDRKNNQVTEIEKKNIGIIGYGHTGKSFSEKLYCFKANVFAYDKYKFNYSNKFVSEVNMEEIYNKCEIISLHVPLTQHTRNLINKEFIDKMKNPFYLLNTSRGPVVSNQDLIYGLKKKKILGAGLDVIENESSKFNCINIDSDFNYLVNCSNVIITPHIAGLSKEANKKLSKILIKKILQIL